MARAEELGVETPVLGEVFLVEGQLLVRGGGRAKALHCYDRRRVMAMHGWRLAPAQSRRTGRAHTGRIMRPGSNERWCSDTLELACWNGEVVVFALDCHDREALGSPHPATS